jgi:cellulose synthase/poly-beta-1,6-N-acetylglucosamine synthase-like glycosyltransferase
MTNIVLITNGSRPRLLAQTLRTLYVNTPADQYTLTMVTDGHIEFPFEQDWGERISVIGMRPPCNILGRLKNLGIYWSNKQFGRGEWLCVLDDDLAFWPGWLEKMAYALECRNEVRILGGVRHPYHGINEILSADNFKRDVKPNDLVQTIESTDAVAGYCHFMRWKTWDRFGPYDAHAKGTGQSEDFAICRKIVDAGGKVGYIHPPVMAHCGVTDSLGRPAIGMEKIQRKLGVLYE